MELGPTCSRGGGAGVCGVQGVQGAGIKQCLQLEQLQRGAARKLKVQPAVRGMQARAQVERIVCVATGGLHGEGW